MAESPRDELVSPTRGIQGELLGFLLLAVLALAVRFFVDPDLGGHLAYGMDSLARRSVPRIDRYSYTASGLPWVNHEWAFEWLLAAVYARAGTTGLCLVQVAFTAASAALVLRLAWRSGADILAVGILWACSMAIVVPALGIRPQLATYVLFPTLLLVLERTRRGRSAAVLWIVPVFALWANVHGGFVAGIGVMGLYAAGMLLDSLRRTKRSGGTCADDRRVALVIGACVPLAAATTLLNPWGIGLWRWLLHSLGTSRSYISEWQSLHPDATGIAVAGLAGITGLALLGSRRKPVPAAHVLVLIATLIESVIHARHAPFFAMSVLAFVPAPLRRLLPGGAGRRHGGIPAGQRWLVRIAGGVVLVPLFALHTGRPPGGVFRLRISPDDPPASYPTGAFEYIEEHEVSGDMVVWFDWAQMVIFRYTPRIRVAYDGRFRTVYPENVERDYFDFLHGAAGADWRRLLDHWPAGWVLLPAAGPATDRMRAQPGWWLVYEDDMAVLFERARAGESPPEMYRRSGRGPTQRFARVVQPGSAR